VFGGCWRRETFTRVGWFNERLVRGQDLEFNLRLGRAGGKILLDPAIRSRYFVGSKLAAFARHNWINGVWAILPFAYSHITPVKWRHTAPLVLILALLLPPWRISAAIAAAYLAANLACSIRAAWREKKSKLAALLPWTFMTLHFCYGAGSLWGLVRLIAIRARGWVRKEQMA
jgi:GT2 family glycosyltransferase